MPTPPTIRAPTIEAGRSIYAPNPAWTRSWLIRMSFIKPIEMQKKAKAVWNPGEIVVWRGIYRGQVWHAQTTIVVKDAPEEMVLTLLPGAECVAPEGYLNGKDRDKRRWNFRDNDWENQIYLWRNNRLLLLLEPQKYYSTIYFWNGDSNEFLFYYINFQLPFQRSHCGIDTLDLDLDLIIKPDFSFEWKDVDDYQKAIEKAIIFPEWTKAIDIAQKEILDKLGNRQYPFDGSWLSWMPDASWSPPKMPVNWDKI